MKRWRRASRALPRWLAPAAVAVVIFTGIALAGGATDHFRFCDLIRVGHFLRPGVLAPCPAHPAVAGYDGQFYYAIARGPWHRHEAGIDAPVVRHARVLSEVTLANKRALLTVPSSAMSYAIQMRFFSSEFAT